jgi:S-adenosylmethionine hydrolase
VNLITLTTDFGLADAFVGTMKGVILARAPRATIVDLTHGVAPGDIRAGAFALLTGCRYFPKGTVHVAVVDPGVGSARRAIAVRTRDYWFVGPDNGVLSWALARETVRSVRRIANARLWLRPVSRTFHGRDVFAPVAAHLARGGSFHSVGPELADYARLPWPALREAGGEITGEVLVVDRFGNAITNIPEAGLPAGMPAGVVWAGRRRLCRVEACYAAVPPGGTVAVFGSSGFLEIAVNGGSAAPRFGLHPGSRVTLRRNVSAESKPPRRTAC